MSKSEARSTLNQQLSSNSQSPLAQLLREMVELRQMLPGLIDLQAVPNGEPAL